jgi:uncharacterized protein
VELYIGVEWTTIDEKMEHFSFIRFFAFVSALAFALADAASADESTHRKAAEELVERIDGKRLLDTMYVQLKETFSASIQQMGMPEKDRPLAQKHIEKLTAVLQEELTWEKLKQPLIEIYMRVYDEQEIRKVNEFYKSPAGQNYLAKLPEVLKESGQLSQQMMQSVLPKLQALEKETTGEIRLALATRDCSAMLPVEPKTVAGRWRSLDYSSFVVHVNYREDGTFAGSVESLGKVRSRFEGQWILEGNQRVDSYTFDTSSPSQVGQEDVDEILAVGCGILTLRNRSGNTVRPENDNY